MTGQTMKKALTLAALAALALPLTALAQPPGGGRHGFGGPHPEMGFERIMRGLELTESQREEIHSLMEARRDESEPLRGDLREKRRAVFEATHAEVLDENAIRAAVLDAAAVEAEIAVARAQVRRQVWEILTPEQRQKAEAMKERMQEFREEFLEDGNERFGRRHGRRHFN